jgi:hypothetical protein
MSLYKALIARNLLPNIPKIEKLMLLLCLGIVGYCFEHAPHLTQNGSGKLLKFVWG